MTENLRSLVTEVVGQENHSSEGTMNWQRSLRAAVDKLIAERIEPFLNEEFSTRFGPMLSQQQDANGETGFIMMRGSALRLLG